MRYLREEPARRAEGLAVVTEKYDQDQRRFQELQVIDWMRTEPVPPPSHPPPPPLPIRPPLSPLRLILVDEADRLRMTSLEQLRDLFDRNDVGMVLIGIPGMEKRLGRYPQLYSRVGFVHAFRPLNAAEIRRLLDEQWNEMGETLPIGGVTDPEAVAAIIRVTGGNFRLLRRLLSQIDRILRLNNLTNVTSAVVEASILRLNNLTNVTSAVVEAAREGLVIGSA